MPSSTPLKECRAPEGQKQAYHFSQLSTNKASFRHVPVLRSRYFFEWVWRGRDEEFRTVEKSDTVPGVQKLGPLGPLGFDFAQRRQTLRPSSSRDPQQSPASFRSAVKVENTCFWDFHIPTEMAQRVWAPFSSSFLGPLGSSSSQHRRTLDASQNSISEFGNTVFGSFS